MIYKLSPSDFAYLYEECKLCYYLKVKNNFVQPSIQMPGVFTEINTLVQTNLVGKSLRTLASDLPDVEVISQETCVESILIPKTSVYIKGKYDLLAKKKDDTFLLIDLKISTPEEEKIEKYKNQLTAYKFALENPKNGEPITISQMALLIFYPDKVEFHENRAYLNFPHSWFDVPINMDDFFTFINDIDKLISGEPPAKSSSCKWCQYRYMFENLV